METKDDFLFKDLTYEIIGAAIEVHNALGPGFTEKVYERGLIIELRERKLSIESQKAIMLNYKRYDIGEHILDLIVEDKVIIELKAVSEFLPIHEAQLISYLKASG